MSCSLKHNCFCRNHSPLMAQTRITTLRFFLLPSSELNIQVLTSIHLPSFFLVILFSRRLALLANLSRPLEHKFCELPSYFGYPSTNLESTPDGILVVLIRDFHKFSSSSTVRWGGEVSWGVPHCNYYALDKSFFIHQFTLCWVIFQIISTVKEDNLIKREC